MEKLTKRKAFNFLRSYFDVVNELQSDSDKLSFLMSIIDKQFLDEDPQELSFLVKLCYSSQKHAIESSVKGWKRVSLTDMQGNPLIDPPTNPPTNLLTNPKEVEVEVKDKVKEVISIIDRKLKFYDTLKPFLDLYDKDMIRAFYDYWSESNKSNSKFKQEMQKTWDTKLRLANWNKNNFGNTNNKKEQQYELTQFTNRLRGLD